MIISLIPNEESHNLISKFEDELPSLHNLSIVALDQLTPPSFYKIDILRWIPIDSNVIRICENILSKF